MMVYPSAKAAIWNPDTDPNLKFNLNFEQNKAGPPPETNDVGPSKLKGTAHDYNDHDANNPFHMWNSQWNGDANAIKIGNYVGDFRKPCDLNIGVVFDACVSVEPSAIFDLGDASTGAGGILEQRTFTFWFYPDIQASSGTLIRHATDDPANYYWEIRMYDGKLQFWSKMGTGTPLRMETTKTLAQLGVQANSWHHAAIVYDRWTREASLMFVDGVQVDRTVISHNKGISASIGEYPVIFGTGSSEFEGMLDECRIYHRTLTPSEVSILYQTDYTTKAIALNPFPNALNVPVGTDFLWAPVAAATRQTFLFSRYSDLNDPCRIFDDGNDMNSVTNADVNGLLALNTTYYWAVDTNVSGTMHNGQIWKFTTETGKAFNPVPTDGQQDVNVGTVDLQWDASASAEKFDVYFADNFDRVNDVNTDARVVQNLADLNEPNFVVSAPTKGETYYWRIVTKFPAGTGLPNVKGDVWSFRIQPKLVIVNTSDAGAMYNEVNYPAKTLTFVEDSCVVNGYLGDDDVVIFDFNSSLNLNEYYSVIVIPDFNNTVEADMNNRVPSLRKTSRPMAIHVNGAVSLNCRVEAFAREASVGTASQLDSPSSQARGGGYRGSYRNEDRTAFNPLEIFGPGYGGNGYAGSGLSPCGAGGGYGGAGGDQARAGGSGGVSYGYPQIPVPLGGSAGGFGNGKGGGGGGAIEIAATGNVTLGTEAQLLVSGGSAIPINYPAGGGAGGSLKIIAGGNFTNSGVVDANGGKGGDTVTTDEPTNPGGGGGGGRVAIFHGGTYTAGQISVAGGAVGRDPNGDTKSQLGAAGTVFESDQSPLKPEYPTPTNGANGIIANGKVTLKWYPGFGATRNEVYCSNSSPPLTKVAEMNGIPAKGGVLRAQQSCDVNVIAGQTYYWYVKAKAGVAEANSDPWSFTAVQDFKLVFNTSEVNDVNYNGQMITRLTCRAFNAGGWSAVLSVGTVAADGVTVFDFNSFNYNQYYTVVVLPEYDYTYDSNVIANQTSRPLAIHVNGNFDFNGVIDISGDDTADTSADQPKARSGGYRGPRYGISKTTPTETAYYPTTALASPYTERYGIDYGTGRTYYLPTANAYKVFGPGIGIIIPPMEIGGGGGYGGVGGDSGRGFYYGMFAGGYPYGDKEIPIPYGGSAGGWGRSTAGGAGGGGVEIVATGSVTLGSSAQIYSEGGSVIFKGNKPGGGGAGGSVRIIAGSAFSNSGIIDVNGGSGGLTDESGKVNQGGGGGAGGRISVYYGTTYNAGAMTAAGGAKGWYYGIGDTSDPCYGSTYASNGDAGTIFSARYDANGVPMKASAPTPRNGNKMVYCPNDTTGNWLTLKWYSGYYKGTAATDTLYFGTNPAPATLITTRAVTARGQLQTVDVNIDPNKTYYWKITTTSGGRTANSDVWSFKTVNWQCTNPLLDSVPWDTGPYCDCFVNFLDFVDLGRYWHIPPTNPTSSGVDKAYFSSLAEFADEWLDSTRVR
jgi:hypothetical protein